MSRMEKKGILDSVLQGLGLSWLTTDEPDFDEQAFLNDWRVQEIIAEIHDIGAQIARGASGEQRAELVARQNDLVMQLETLREHFTKSGERPLAAKSAPLGAHKVYG